MNLYIYQKYYVQYNIIETKNLSYFTCLDLFKKQFKDVEFKITEDAFQKIKTTINGTVKNKSIEEICNSLKDNNKDIIVEIYPINSEFKTKDKETQIRSQNIS